MMELTLVKGCEKIQILKTKSFGVEFFIFFRSDSQFPSAFNQPNAKLQLAFLLETGFKPILT